MNSNINKIRKIANKLNWMIWLTLFIQVIMGILYLIDPMLLTYSMIMLPFAIAVGVVVLIKGFREKNLEKIILGIIYTLPFTVVLVVIPNPITIIGLGFYFMRIIRTSK